jgi:hypothetical protein
VDTALYFFSGLFVMVNGTLTEFFSSSRDLKQKILCLFCCLL